MNEWVRRALPALLISTGLLFTGAAAAHAEDSVGNQGVGSGNQVNAPITVPVNVCGNAIGVLGNAGAPDASCGEDEKAPPVTSTPTATPSSPASPSPSVTPLGNTSSPEPGGGGESLPLTGSSVGWLIGMAMLLLAGGGAMLLLARRRIIRRGAHAA